MSPGRPDPQLLRRHLAALDTALQTLRSHRNRPIDELRTDREELWIVLHGLQLCAQNVLDSATHIAASAGFEVPDYASAIERLGELGVLTPDQVKRLRPLAGFRNVLVHGYLDLDLHIVHRVLNEGLEDLAAFARAVDEHLG